LMHKRRGLRGVRSRVESRTYLVRGLPSISCALRGLYDPRRQRKPHLQRLPRNCVETTDQGRLEDLLAPCSTAFAAAWDSNPDRQLKRLMYSNQVIR